MGNWMTTYTSTEQVEDPNPLIWINAAKKSKTKEDAYYKIERAIYYAKKQDEICINVKANIVYMYLRIKFNIVKILVFIIVILIAIVGILIWKRNEVSGIDNQKMIEKKMLTESVKQVTDTKEQVKVRESIPIRQSGYDAGDIKEQVKVRESIQPKVENKNEDASSVISVLSNYGYNIKRNEILGTSFGNNRDGFLTVLDKYIVIIDLNNKTSATMRYARDTMKNITKFGSNTAYFVICIRNDKKNKDYDAGSWRNDDHFIPIQVKYNWKANGKLELGMIKTCYKQNPTFNQYLQEQKNVDLVNLVITEMPALREDYRRNGNNM